MLPLRLLPPAALILSLLLLPPLYLFALYTGRRPLTGVLQALIAIWRPSLLGACARYSLMLRMSCSTWPLTPPRFCWPGCGPGPAG